MDGAYADFHKITLARILNPFLKGPLNPFFKVTILIKNYISDCNVYNASES